jgi:hypothetical protein
MSSGRTRGAADGWRLIGARNPASAGGGCRGCSRYPRCTFAGRRSPTRPSTRHGHCGRAGRGHRRGSYPLARCSSSSRSGCTTPWGRGRDTRTGNPQASDSSRRESSPCRSVLAVDRHGQRVAVRHVELLGSEKPEPREARVARHAGDFRIPGVCCLVHCGPGWVDRAIPCRPNRSSRPRPGGSGRSTVFARNQCQVSVLRFATQFNDRAFVVSHNAGSPRALRHHDRRGHPARRRISYPSRIGLPTRLHTSRKRSQPRSVPCLCRSAGPTVVTVHRADGPGPAKQQPRRSTQRIRVMEPAEAQPGP